MIQIHHIRIVVGAFFLYAAYGERSWVLAIFAAILIYQGLTKKTCGPAGCSIEDQQLKQTHKVSDEK